jgi:hypothetical protein
MTIADSKPRRRLSPLLFSALVVLPFLSSPSPVLSSPWPVGVEEDCLLKYVNCVDAASGLQSFWNRSGQGILCYLDLISCLQRRLAP